MKNNNINLMNLAPRCHATSKRSGNPCQAPAVKGWKVCRFHGAGGGAPSGKKNGNYRHGGRTQETMAAVAYFTAMAKFCKHTLDEMS